MSGARFQSISCGSNGEWFARFWDDIWRLHGSPDELVDGLKEEKRDVLAIDFGSKGSCWVLFVK